MPSGGRLIAAGLGLVAGSAVQLQQPALWGAGGYVALAVAGVVGLSAVWLQGRRRGGDAARAAPAAWATSAIVALAIAAMAFAATGLRAQARLDTRLPHALEGVDLDVTGVIDGLPQRADDAWRFTLAVESARRDGQRVSLPPRLSLGWYAQGDAVAALPDLRAGQRWRLALRLKRPHGLVNPHGFDYELYLFERGLGATGYVRTVASAHNELLAQGVGHVVDRARQAVRERIAERVPDAPAAAGVLAALAVGDQAAIERDDWALYRNTGVAHLMSISGLHITMLAWLAGLAIDKLWRRSPRAMLAWPAPRAARWGGLLVALAYSIFAGWGVPAQRTVLMLATTTVLQQSGLRWPWPLVWASAAVAVVALDPWALLQPGFWLSFVAVGLLMASDGGRGPHPDPLPRAGEGTNREQGADAASDAAARAPASAARRLATALARSARGGLRTQVVATLGLAPLGIVFFQQISLIGFVANLVAIPLVTLLITPLALLGVIAPPLWSLAALLAGVLDALLRTLAAPAWATWQVAAAEPWAIACGLLGGAIALLPLPPRVRLLGLPLVLPLLMPWTPRPAEGTYELSAADVGQGTAVVLRTATHTLLYDTGPQYSIEADAGERVLLPLLHALGERRVDVMMLSHRDSDHVGGADTLLRGLPVAVLSSSLEPTHPLLALARERGTRVQRCTAGERWRWDGVDFELLHPTAQELDDAQALHTKSNALSCVLRVQGRWAGAAHVALLTGDIERAQEAELLAGQRPEALAAELLLVPHHGSKTSSSAAFLDAVAPRVAIVQAGYRNRFGHPAAPVLQRLRERGIEIVQNAHCGAWTYGPEGASCARAVSRRYWRDSEAPTPAAVPPPSLRRAAAPTLTTR